MGQGPLCILANIQVLTCDSMYVIIRNARPLCGQFTLLHILSICNRDSTILKHRDGLPIFTITKACQVEKKCWANLQLCRLTQIDNDTQDIKYKPHVIACSLRSANHSHMYLALIATQYTLSSQHKIDCTYVCAGTRSSQHEVPHRDNGVVLALCRLLIQFWACPRYAD